MEKTLEVIKNMKRDGIFEDYVIAGDIGTIFYTEPYFCQYLDVLMLLENGQESISAVYDYLQEKGYKNENSHFWIEGVAVRLHPVSNELEETAVINASRKRYRNITVRVCKPEYLIAMFVKRDDIQDLGRVSFLREQTKIDNAALERVLRIHCLYEKYLNRFPLSQ